MKALGSFETSGATHTQFTSSYPSRLESSLEEKKKLNRGKSDRLSLDGIWGKVYRTGVLCVNAIAFPCSRS
jgi:hypothetical protein